MIVVILLVVIILLQLTTMRRQSISHRHLGEALRSGLINDATIINNQRKS